ncbi:hypothetical protein KBB12_03735 [Candidatus Woesebacteria bacterium]|nr:hypothetical protein [Candidatus Woesebacteria bacterium]
MSERLLRIFGIFKDVNERKEDSPPLVAESAVDNPTNVPTESTSARTPTMDELLARVYDPSHPSQQQFAPGRDGRMLETCVYNHYSFRGKPVYGRRPPAYSYKAEVAMQSIQLPPKRPE